MFYTDLRLGRERIDLNIGERELNQAETKVVVLVSNRLLRQTIRELMMAFGGTAVSVQDERALWRALRQYPGAILLADLSALKREYRLFWDDLTRVHPALPVVLLVPGDMLPLCDFASLRGTLPVETERAELQLLPALCRARQATLSGGADASHPEHEREENSMEQKTGSFLTRDFTRRSFLKGSAAAAAAAGVAMSGGMKLLSPAEAAPGTEPVKEDVFAGVCRGNCGGGCFLNVHVRDGKVVRTSARDYPDTRYNRICVKGLTHVYRMYHPERIKYPMKRVGERGEGKWERITWDEALDTIADKWTAYQSQYGSSSVAMALGSGSYAVCGGQDSNSATVRFANSLGMSSMSLSVDGAIGPGLLPALGIGPLFTGNEPVDLLNAKTILIWGANPVHSQAQTMHFILEARDKGAKIVVIDPIYTATASKADIYVPVRPGTDGVLAMAMLNIVVRENWVDWDFVEHHTVAPFLVKESDGKFLRLSDLGPLEDGQADAPVVRGKSGRVGLPGEIVSPVMEGSFTVEGHRVTTAYSLLLAAIQEYTPEKAAEVCNLPLTQIEELARLYACNTPSSIYHFFGIDHYVNGHIGYKATSTLAALTGNIGKPGAYCGMNETLAIHFVNFGTTMPAGAPGVSVAFPKLQLTEVLESKKFGQADINLKAMYITHANYLGNAAERQNVLKELAQIEFIVMADMNMNETARHADILLPAAHWFETEDAFAIYSTHPYALWQDKAVDPLYESKPDYEILQALAERMGRGHLMNLSKQDYIRTWLDNDVARALGVTVENLMEQKAIRTFGPAPFIHAEGGAFGTATGRAEFYIETFTADFNYGQAMEPEKEHLPYWEPPNEAWHKHPLAQKYPFILLNVHPKWRTHSQWWDVEVFKELDPEPTVHINPADAAQKGIGEGDKVKVFNDRGYVVMRANLNSGMQPGCVSVPKGWEKQQFIDGHYQDLSSRVHHPMVHNSAFFDALVGIAKV